MTTVLRFSACDFSFHQIIIERHSIHDAIDGYAFATCHQVREGPRTKHFGQQHLRMHHFKVYSINNKGSVEYMSVIGFMQIVPNLRIPWMYEN